jgi:hypothetical protein
LADGISADPLNDDGLGRTLDWLSEHDVTTLVAELAFQARRRFGMAAKHLPIDTTSFAVSGDAASLAEGDPVPGATPAGSARDHHQDLTHGMLALATTHDGERPVFLRPLDGKLSAKAHLSAAVHAVMTQLREELPEAQEQRRAVVDSGSAVFLKRPPLPKRHWRRCMRRGNSFQMAQEQGWYARWIGLKERNAGSSCVRKPERERPKSRERRR